MPACVYCGKDAGEYDEHAECVERSIAERPYAVTVEGNAIQIDVDRPLDRFEAVGLQSAVTEALMEVAPPIPANWRDDRAWERTAHLPKRKPKG